MKHPEHCEIANENCLDPANLEAKPRTTFECPRCGSRACEQCRKRFVLKGKKYVYCDNCIADRQR